MRRPASEDARVKNLLVATAVLAAAVALLVALTLPPKRLSLQIPSPDHSVPGIVHVHSNRSDGQSSPDEIAAAAARAGLRFVVFTDHGDATRAPEPPVYKSGVLCVDAVEISTTGGHYIALDMPAAPYPLAGEPRDVADDVRRLGGFGIVAHPDSPKPELQWRDWSVPFDGVETLNLDTSWREWVQQAQTGAIFSRGRWSAWRTLASALMDYPFRPPETIASLTRPDARLDTLMSGLKGHRRIVTIAGADAHARLAVRGDPADSGLSLPIPGYEQTFKTLSVHVMPEQAFTMNARKDAAMLLRAIRSGHLYTAIDGIATPPSFDFTATNTFGTVHEGDVLGAGDPVTLRVRSNAPAAFTTLVFADGRVLSGGHHEPDVTVAAPADPAVYRVAIVATGRRSPMVWLRSNPIYVRGSEPDAAVPPAAHAAATASQAIFDGTSTAGFHLEHDPDSRAAIEASRTIGGSELRLRYALAGGVAAGQYAALVYDTPAGLAADRLTFTVRAEHPMRISIQVRVPGTDDRAAGERWQRSVYVGAFDQERTVFFDDMTPAGATRTPVPRLAEVRSIIFAIDTVNTQPGASGRLWIKRAALER